MPYLKAVFSLGDIIDGETAIDLADSEQGCVERDDDRAHLRMNIAEDVRDAGAVEDDRPGLAARIEAEVEAPAVI
jgi:hypothetical protein